MADTVSFDTPFHIPFLPFLYSVPVFEGLWVGYFSVGNHSRISVQLLAFKHFLEKEYVFPHHFNVIFLTEIRRRKETWPRTIFFSIYEILQRFGYTSGTTLQNECHMILSVWVKMVITLKQNWDDVLECVLRLLFVNSTVSIESQIVLILLGIAN